MKRLMLGIVLFLAFLIMPLSANAGDCERYWTDLIGVTFEVTLDGVDYTLSFSDSSFGPCPCGFCDLEYVDVKYIDGIPYEAEICLEFNYSTDWDFVTIAKLTFVLTEDGRQLILLPEIPLMFETMEE